MVFFSPAWVPQLLCEPPDSISVGQFVLGQSPLRPQSVPRRPFVDGFSGNSYSIAVLQGRVELLARSLSKELGWLPNSGTPWNKVVAIYSLNTVRFQLLMI